MKKFRMPMLAYNKPFDLGALRYPLMASPKLDGIRCVVLPRGPVSRNMKPIANLAVREWLRAPALRWMDGELVCGDPRDPAAFNRASSQIMRRDGGRAGVTFHVFDRVEDLRAPFAERSLALTAARAPRGVVHVPQRLVGNAAQARLLVRDYVRAGYEGMMLRSPDAPYKQGRSGLADHGLLKVKLFEDSEALVLEVFPRMRNENAQETDERGYARRRKLRAGMVVTDELGGFRVRDLRTKKEFSVAPGVLTEAQRRELWRYENRIALPNRIIKYRFQPAGAKDLPRFPRFVGFRDRRDM